MNSKDLYRIGEAASLSGVNADTIRAWERRYGAVAPERDDSNLRLYRAADVERLTLMQQLSERGARIGDIATLSADALRARLEASRPAPGPAPQGADEGPIPLVLVGEGLSEFLRDDDASLVVADAYPGLQEWAGAKVPAGAVVLIQRDTLDDGLALRIIDYARQSRARMVLILYRFAPMRLLDSLRAAGMMTMRATQDVGELRHALLARHYWEAAGRRDVESFLAEPVPPPMFDAAALRRVRSLSGALACECPRHLAELISALDAFEDYSAECESRNTQDAATHAMLRGATAHARRTMERALEQLIEIEGLAERLAEG